MGPRLIWGLRLASLLTVLLGSTELSASPVGQVRVMLQNDDVAPADVITSAQSEVVRLFALIDVEVQWVAAAEADLRGVGFVKVTNWEPSDPRFSTNVLGATFFGERGTAKRAYVVWPRVQRLARRHAIGLDAMLAVAIAHEMGHMLLPNRPHGKTGLMRATWDANDLRFAAAGLLHFSRESAVKIAQGLRPGVAIAEDRRH